MIEAIIGESVILTRRLVKNNKVVTGADLKVRVVELPAGNEVLASTTVPESSDLGCYAFEWFGFPGKETFLKAIYSVKNTSESELIQVKEKATGSPPQNVVALVRNEQKVTAIIKDPIQVKVTVLQPKINVLVPQQKSVIVVIKQPKVFVKIACEG